MWELRKLFIKNRAILFIAVFAALHAGMIMIARLSPKMWNDSVFERYSSGRQLFSYYEQYGGRLTEEKEAAILLKKAQIDGADRRMNELISERGEGLITENEFVRALNEISPLLGERLPFSVFYENFDYCRGDPEHRYMMDTRGWREIFASNGPDLFITLLTVILAAMIYKADIGGDVIRIIKPTSRGYSALLFSKWGAALSLAFALAAASAAVDFTAAACAYPLGDGGAPLESISFFEGAKYELSLLGSFFLVSAIRFFGLLYCAVTVVTLSELTRNAVLSGFIGGVFAVLPFVMGQQDGAYLRWPTPAGFITAVPYVTCAGDVDLSTLAVAAALSALVMLALLALSYMHYRGVRLPRAGRSAAALMLTLALVPVLPGCGGAPAPAKDVTFGCPYADILAEADDYYVHYDDGVYTVYEKETGDSFPLLNDPFADINDDLRVRTLCAYGNTVYFFERFCGGCGQDRVDRP